jgi:hypothetical protein
MITWIIAALSADEPRDEARELDGECNTTARRTHDAALDRQKGVDNRKQAA